MQKERSEMKTLNIPLSLIDLWQWLIKPSGWCSEPLSLNVIHHSMKKVQACLIMFIRKCVLCVCFHRTVNGRTWPFKLLWRESDASFVDKYSEEHMYYFICCMQRFSFVTYLSHSHVLDNQMTFNIRQICKKGIAPPQKPWWIINLLWITTVFGKLISVLTATTRLDYC